ncbi:hypothetical protein SELMODRAFT_429686 [Selaginella moellendorffii]|uniref:DUF4408 domain-containing protein n=1 Tax=Selaginella moellendorffii TaxID=88036 RepID=D8T6Z3_SELML|nr:hypothetical protein SELMODRAFT_429686 [Selaginella moellendorffii]
MAAFLLLFQGLRSSLLFAVLVPLLLALDSEAIRSRAPNISMRSLFLAVNLLVITLFAMGRAAQNPGSDQLSRALVVHDDANAAIPHIIPEGGNEFDILVVSSSSFGDYPGEELKELEFCGAGESLALVVTSQGDPELLDSNHCRDMVPAPSLCDELPPETPVEVESPVVISPGKIKKKGKKARKSPPVSSNPGRGTNAMVTVGVDGLLDCSMDDFNRACSAIIKLHRKEWQLR